MSEKTRAKRKAAGQSTFSTFTAPKKGLKAKTSGSLDRLCPIRRQTKIKAVGKSKAKRVARNREYYAGAEWRAKRKAVFERDGFQCTEMLTGVAYMTSDDPRAADSWMPGWEPPPLRCPNRGEVVNGKQTARGLVCEETSYGHRGNPDRIDTCKTRCKDCDRRLTAMERVNHSQGFNNHRRG